MKNLKRFSGLVLALLIALNLTVVPAMAKNYYTVGTTSTSLKAAKEILFYEDFNNKQSGTVANGNLFGNSAYNTLSIPTSNGITGTVEVKGDGTDNYLAVTGTNSAKGRFMLRESTGNVFKGTYITEFKFMVPDISATSANILFTNRGGASTNQKDRYGARIKLSGDTDLFHHFPGGTDTSLSDVTVKQGVWYNIKVVTDFDNLKYSLYINGRNFVNNAAFYSESGFKSDACTNMLEPFRVADVIGTIYYDDIVMYCEPTGRITYSAEDFSGYSADRDWTSFENSAFVGATNMPATYNANAVDMWDTWLEGIAFSPAKQNTYGKIDAQNDRLVLGGHTNQQSVVLLDGYRNTSGKSEKMAVSFTFTPTDGDGYYDSFWQMRDNFGANPGVRLQLSNGKFIADTNSGGVVLLSGVEDNKPYNFTVASDSTTATYSVYIDGACVGSNLAFKFASGNTSYSDHGRPFEVNLAKSAPECYYDNIVIYTDEREYVMAAAMNTAKANYSAVTNSQNTFALPASTVSGYTLSWSSDNAAISVDNGTATITYPEQTQTVTLTATVADADNEYAIERKLVVNVPSKYEVNVTENEGVVTGTVTVSGSSSEGYNDGWAILAVYNGNQMVSVKKENVVNGKATVVLDTITTEGNYKARLFLLKKDVLIPITDDTTPIEFVID